MHTDRDALAAARPDGMDEGEWALRLELAACYRLFDHLGWAEAIFNHITVRVPSPDPQTPHYLINPFGLHYSEVTASNLIKIDVSGEENSALMDVLCHGERNDVTLLGPAADDGYLAVECHPPLEDQGSSYLSRNIAIRPIDGTPGKLR